MNDDRPNGPETATGSPAGEVRRFPPFSQDPSRVDVGFPSGAVERLRRPRSFNSAGGASVDVADLDEVLAWIDRYVPRAFACDVGHEIEVGGVGILTIGSEEPFADSVELIRFNGRTFVEETPIIVDDGDPHDLAFRLGEAVGSFEGGHCTKPQLADNVIEIVHGLIEEGFGPELGAACDEIVAPCPVLGCVRDDADHAEAFERRPAVEGLECVKALGPAYERDRGGRPVHIGDAEPTDAEGRFPGDLGYVRPS